MAITLIFFSLRPKKEYGCKNRTGWKELLKAEFSKPYFEQIPLHLKTEKEQGKKIFPPARRYLMLLI
jgi:uracil DNA glycosylase